MWRARPRPRRRDVEGDATMQGAAEMRAAGGCSCSAAATAGTAARCARRPATAPSPRRAAPLRAAGGGATGGEGEAAVLADDLWLTYGGAGSRQRQVAALRGATLSVAPGTLHMLLGPNGCGKARRPRAASLLQSSSRVYRASSRRVRPPGRPGATRCAVDADALLRRHAAARPGPPARSRAARLRVPESRSPGEPPAIHSPSSSRCVLSHRRDDATERGGTRSRARALCCLDRRW